MDIVILDRDGVINHDSDRHVRSPDEWEAIPGSLDAIARLNRGGFRVVVASNQSGLRRKLFDIETLNAIHEKMHRQLAEVGGMIDAVFFCPCLPREQCDCRKPSPGMLVEISKRLRIGLDGVPCVGDSARDLEAARAVGARPMLVRTGKGMRTIESGDGVAEDVEIFDDLAAVADALIAARAA